MKISVQLYCALVAFCGPLFATASYYTYKSSSSDCGSSAASPCGPDYWSSLSSTCSASSQSPINIVASEVVWDKSFQAPIPIKDPVTCTKWVQRPVNSVFNVDFTGSTGCTHLGVSYKGATYTLTHINIHSPSEHALGGGKYSAEAQLYHTSASGDTIAVAVLLNEVNLPDSNNVLLDELWAAASYTTATLTAGVTVSGSTVINPYTSLLPADTTQYYYWGSETTPACNQDLEWFVYAQPVSISSEDLTFIRQSVAGVAGNILDNNGNNDRQVQDLNDRTVVAVSGEVVPTSMPTLAPVTPTAAPTSKWYKDSTHSQNPSVPRSEIALYTSSLAISIFGFFTAVLAVGLVWIYNFSAAAVAKK